MSKKYTAKNIKLEDLVLDKENPRFAELYNGSDKESDIVEYLLYTESADEVAEAISTAGEFYEDRPLWVFKENEKYIVKDGNRRCSAVKALQLPNKYGLEIPKFEITELPVLEYNDLSDIETRIRLEHNSSLFKKWGRIAKALEIYRLFSSGNSRESLTEIDSNPKDFIKTATFYHKAVKIKGEDFKKLVREGRGKTGKTIIFERLFRERAKCGYSFKHTGEIFIKDNSLFESYINAIVPYLIDNPNSDTSRTIDQSGTDNFLAKLKPYGFPPNKPTTTNSQNTSSGSNSTNSGTTTASTANNDSNASTSNNSNQNNSANTTTLKTTNSGSQRTTTTRHSVKHKPSLKRKQIPSALKKLIDECYNLDENNFANAKTALTRVTLECTLKYVVENTKKTNGNPIKSANHFDLAFKDRRGNALTYTNFDTLKSKFTELITDVGIRKAFEDFDIQNPHQIIHNYRVAAVPATAKAICDNLIDLLEFMLQEEADLVNSLDTNKL